MARRRWTPATWPTRVILLRYFEAAGEVRQAISVLKKRTRHARADDPRNARRASNGIAVGEPLREFQGVLTGVPQERQVMTEHGLKADKVLVTAGDDHA